MTIEERIERFNMALSLSMEEGAAESAKSQLHELLKQVAREQRRYCAESGFDIETGKYTFEAIQTARSPLNEDSHE